MLNQHLTKLDQARLSFPNYDAFLIIGRIAERRMLDEMIDLKRNSPVLSHQSEDLWENER